MSWQALILISVFLASVSAIMQRLLMRDQKNDAIVASVLLQIISGLIIGLVGLITNQLDMVQNYGPVIWNFLLMIILYSTGGIAMFKAYQTMNPSRFAILFALRAVFTLLFSSILLNESLTIENFVGLILIIVSIVLINYEKGGFKLQKGDLFALYTAFAFGTSNTNDRFLLNTIDVYPYMVLGFILPALVNLIIYNKRFRPFKTYINQEYLKKMALLCIIYAGSAIFFFVALEATDNSSQLASLNLLNGVITVLMSIVIFKEKDKLLLKIIAALISLMGLLLIA
jgi:drug/metabolite transporter (DMT)-like permease